MNRRPPEGPPRKAARPGPSEGTEPQRSEAAKPPNTPKLLAQPPTRNCCRRGVVRLAQVRGQVLRVVPLCPWCGRPLAGLELPRHVVARLGLDFGALPVVEPEAA